MEFGKMLRYLLDEKLIVILDGKPVATLAFEEKVRSIGPARKEQKVLLEKEIIPAKLTETQKRQIWADFVEAAGVPHRITTDNGAYTVRQYSRPAVDQLIEILNSLNAEEEQKFKEATKNYYKTIGYPQGLAKYLIDGTWLLELKEWKKTGGKQEARGVNRFEI